MNLEESLSDLVHYCRACLSKDKTKVMHSLLDPEIHTIFTSCTSLSVSLDKQLPLKICSLCYGHCETWETFRRKCLETDNALKRIVTGQEDVIIIPDTSPCIVEIDQQTGDCEERDIFSDYEDQEEVEHSTIELLADCRQEIIIEKKSQPQPPLIEDKEIYKCHICDAEYRQRHRLKDHMHRHEDQEYLCKVCGKPYKTPLALTRHTRVHTAKPVFCEICGVQFNTRRGLSIHLVSHTSNTNFSCDDCGKQFKYHSNLLQHQKRHQGVKNFQCPSCDKNFFTGSELTIHTKKVHSQIRPHQCSFCGKAFVQPSLLKIHLRRHTGEQNYSCDQCPNKFTSIYGLRNHKLIHTGEKPHQCTVCLRYFRLKDTLRTHMKVHAASE